MVGVGTENDSGPAHQHRRGDHPACSSADLAGGSGRAVAVVAAHGAGPPTAPGTVLTSAVGPLGTVSCSCRPVSAPDVEKAALHRRLPEHPGRFVMPRPGNRLRTRQRPHQRTSREESGLRPKGSRCLPGIPHPHRAPVDGLPVFRLTAGYSHSGPGYRPPVTT